MTFSEDSTMGDILDNAAAKAHLENLYPEIKSMEAVLNMVRGFSLKQIVKMPGSQLTAAQLPDFLKILNSV